jgi:hypothetical protein
VTGASVRAGTVGAGECGAAAWLRCGTSPAVLGPACWGVTVRCPAADGATADCRGPATREYNPKPSATTSASASVTAQPSPRPEERAVGRRRCRGAWADVASNSSRLTVDNTSGDRQTASYSSTSGPGSAPTALAMPRMCPRA